MGDEKWKSPNLDHADDSPCSPMDPMDMDTLLCL
jgi:hypothetical protein